MTEQQTAPVLAPPRLGASGPIAVLLGLLVTLGVARAVWRLFGLVVLLAIVGATVGALVGGILLLRMLVG